MDIQVHYNHREGEVREALDVGELAAMILTGEGLPDSTEVSVSFVDDDTIHALNREYRDVDRPTDVLSFECDGADGQDVAVSGEPFELGDVVVAPDVAMRQAPAYDMSFADEVSLLVTHGLLHLCGYDHMEQDEAAQMEGLEREYLSKFWGRPFKRCGEEG